MVPVVDQTSGPHNVRQPGGEELVVSLDDGLTLLMNLVNNVPVLMHGLLTTISGH